MHDGKHAAGPLAGVRVLDLSRVLAGPTCTQHLGDLGASVLKIENPGTGGDDTRHWGPPFVDLPDGDRLSAYFLSSNRNKMSAAVDIASDEGRALLRRLASLADVLVENFRPGGLARYGLDWEGLREINPRLVYCSVSGWGQTGPNAAKPGYDLMAQGWGGIMSLTGAADGPPMKVGVAVADVVCGLYACTGILAALRHAEATGQGQHVEIALADSQLAWLVNQGVSARVTGAQPLRHGNDHPTIVPYGVHATADGHVIVAVGNDRQFAAFCKALDLSDLVRDPRFRTNPDRVANRAALVALIEPALAGLATAEAIARLEGAGVPTGPVQDLPAAFASEQARARGMCLDMEAGGTVLPLIGNPLKFSVTPVSYRRPPPRLDADGDRLDREDPFAP